MSETAPRDRTRQATVRCPTCRAVQEWSDSCRRCKCDLRLLRDVAEAYERSRRLCLLGIRSGQPAAALRHARRCHWLRPGADSTRLLALCSFLSGQWATAAGLTLSVPDD
jgi:hypothetical protein